MCMFPFLDFILYTIQYNDHLDITYIQLDILSRDELYYIGRLYTLPVNAVSFSMGLGHSQILVSAA